MKTIVDTLNLDTRKGIPSHAIPIISTKEMRCFNSLISLYLPCALCLDQRTQRINISSQQIFIRHFARYWGKHRLTRQMVFITSWESPDNMLSYMHLRAEEIGGHRFKSDRSINQQISTQYLLFARPNTKHCAKNI